MNVTAAPTFPTLVDDVRTALRQWHGEAAAPSPLRYLYFFRKTLRERQQRGLSGERGATNELLRRVIERLEESHETDAQFLQQRFLDLWPIQRLANQHNLAESTIYTMQARAIERLAETLRWMEIEASRLQKNRLTMRLDAASYITLQGVEASVNTLRGQLLNEGPPWLIAVEGIGGIGKTALADFIMRELIQQGLYDEVGWVTARQVRFNLGGALNTVPAPALTAAVLIEKLAAQLMPELITPTRPSADELLRALRARLKSIPHLITVDNLETLADVESLLPTLQSLSEPTKFLLTSRESLRSEPNIFPLTLEELGEADALKLIRHEATISNLPLLAACTDEELLPIVDVVGGNPLALRLVTGQTHIYPLDVILNDLRKAQGETMGNLFTFIYRRAWEALSETTRHVFLVMPLAHPGGESLDFLAGICLLAPEQVRPALNQLVLQNLVDARGGLHERRYSIHSLTRTFLHDEIAKW